MSSLASAANVFDTPAVVKWRGSYFYSKGPVKLTPTIESTRITTDKFGELGSRKGDVGLRVDLPLAGEWENTSLLLPYGAFTRGVPIGITRNTCSESGINTTTNRLTITAHGLSNADPVTLGTTGIFPTVASTALAAGTTYYAKAIDADTLELYREVGLSTIVDFSDDGTGSLIISKENALDIYLLNYGQKLTLHNAALVKQPDIIAGASDTIFGEVGFEAFLRGGYAPGTAASYYTFSEEAFTDTSFSPASILTQPLTIAWGSSSPWSDLDVAEAVKITFDMKTTPIRSDAHGLRGRKFGDLSAKISLKPRGANALQALTLLAPETARGTTRTMGALNLSGTNFYFRIYDTNLLTAPHQFGAEADLHDSFELEALRTIASGAAVALFYAGTAAP